MIFSYLWSFHLIFFPPIVFFFFFIQSRSVQVTEILVTLKKKKGERDLSAQVTQPQMSLSLRKIRLQAYVMCGPVFLPLSFSECVSFVSLSGQLEPGLGSSGHIPVGLVTMGREALCCLQQLGKSQWRTLHEPASVAKGGVLWLEAFTKPPGERGKGWLLY